jgi:hypothetical protein
MQQNALLFEYFQGPLPSTDHQVELEEPLANNSDRRE